MPIEENEKKLEERSYHDDEKERKEETSSDEEVFFSDDEEVIEDHIVRSLEEAVLKNNCEHIYNFLCREGDPDRLLFTARQAGYGDLCQLDGLMRWLMRELDMQGDPVSIERFKQTTLYAELIRQHEHVMHYVLESGMGRHFLGGHSFIVELFREAGDPLVSEKSRVIEAADDGSVDYEVVEIGLSEYDWDCQSSVVNQPGLLTQLSKIKLKLEDVCRFKESKFFLRLNNEAETILLFLLDSSVHWRDRIFLERAIHPESSLLGIVLTEHDRIMTVIAERINALCEEERQMFPAAMPECCFFQSRHQREEGGGGCVEKEPQESLTRHGALAEEENGSTYTLKVISNLLKKLIGFTGSLCIIPQEEYVQILIDKEYADLLFQLFNAVQLSRNDIRDFVTDGCIVLTNRLFDHYFQEVFGYKEVSQDLQNNIVEIAVQIIDYFSQEKYQYQCPISFEFMRNPVKLGAGAQYYERTQVEQHFHQKDELSLPHTDPLTNLELTKDDVIHDADGFAIQIQQFRAQAFHHITQAIFVVLGSRKLSAMPSQKLQEGLDLAKECRLPEDRRHEERWEALQSWLKSVGFQAQEFDVMMHAFRR